MRFALALLAMTACSRIFGLEDPTRRTDGVDGAVDGVVDGVVDTATGSDAMLSIKTFRRGVDGYMATVDVFLNAANPTSNSNTSIDIRARDGEDYGLLMFDGVFSPTQVPVGAQIQLARLQLTSQDAGCTARLVEVAVAWNDTTTFNTFGPQAGIQTGDLGAVVVAALPTGAGDIVLDVTSSLQAWSINPTANHGWMIEPAGSGACKIRSGDVGNLAERPRLEVIYTN